MSGILHRVILEVGVYAAGARAKPCPENGVAAKLPEVIRNVRDIDEKIAE